MFLGKKKKIFKRTIFDNKLKGSHIKGGLELCDALLLEHQDNSFVDVEDIVTRLKHLRLELNKKYDGDLSDPLSTYTYKLADVVFNKRVKEKIAGNTFGESVEKTVLRGSIKACEDLINSHEKDPCDTIEIFIGEVHILRWSLWTAYCKLNPHMPKATLEDAMEIDPKNLAKYAIM